MHRNYDENEMTKVLESLEQVAGDIRTMEMFDFFESVLLATIVSASDHARTMEISDLVNMQAHVLAEHLLELVDGGYLDFINEK